MTAQKSILVRRDGTSEVFEGRKLHTFLAKLRFGLNEKFVEVDVIVNKVHTSLPEKLAIDEFYDIVAETIASRTIVHSDHALLAGRVEAVRLQKSIPFTFSENTERLYNNVLAETGKHSNLVSRKVLDVVRANLERLNSAIHSSRDLELTYFGIKTLQKSYLLQIEDEIAETPQFMFLRVALGIHGDDVESAIETYDYMSKKLFIHASPTLFNSGTDYNFLSSCFLLAMESDSIDGIYKTLHKTALISKCSGGIGLHVHNIRSAGSHINPNGKSSGLVPMLRVFNNTARYVDQGGNKRPGAFAIYIEPWHADIFDVLNLRKNHGKEEMRARDLFYALWVPDLFMERVRNDEDWSLLSPDRCPGLSDVVGEQFKQLYEKYEREGRAMTVIKAQKLWHAILEAQTETGQPYVLFKDACNLKTNQQNLGVIKSSNLCCEVVQYSSPEETAVCNLGSLALPSYVNETDSTVEFDFVKLHEVTKVLTRNLDKVIDVTRYPVKSAEVSNKRHRPIAVGVQGLADTFALLRIPFDSKEAKLLNIQIFETIYHAAVEASVELSAKYGPYSSFKGSPASEGKLQFDLWNHKPSRLYTDWDVLKARVQAIGLRNSLLVAPMPTASTSQILGFNECFEPFTSNIYTRRVLSGEFQVVNKYLVRDLVELGLWNKSIRDQILVADGSIQGISGIPDAVKALYKTVWEISQKVIIDMASDRGRFIDQAQSMNIHMKSPTFGKLTSCLFYSWEKGLKTGLYYLRTQAASKAIQFTVDKQAESEEPAPTEVRHLKRKRYIAMDHSVSLLEAEKKKSRLPTPESQQMTPGYEYDIFDEKVRACNITNAEACDSCSG